MTRTTRRPQRGFTLIELMTVVTIAGILSTIAFPSLEGQLQRARRVDAMVSMMAVQLAQERWRSNAPSYATLAQIGVAATSANRHYTLAADHVDADGYEVTASAIGAQQRDRACRHLRLSVAGGSIVYASGPDGSVANPEPLNRRCWSRGV
jgi:type IV pilus assembly protein PilE